MGWVGLQCVIVLFPDQNHLVFEIQTDNNELLTKHSMKTFVKKTDHNDCYTNKLQWVVQETTFKIVIQMDRNELSTKQTMTTLLYRLAAMGYPRNKT